MTFNNRELCPDKSPIWAVKKTAMYPNKFKVYPVRLYLESNGPEYYHPTFELAAAHAKQKNLREVEIQKQLSKTNGVVKL